MGLSLPLHVSHGRRHVPRRGGEAMSTRIHNGARVHVAVAAWFLPMAVILMLTAGSVHAGAQMSMPSPGLADGPSPNIKDSMMENPVFTHARLDQFEGRTSGAESEFRWDGEGWIGTDMNKL